MIRVSRSLLRILERQQEDIVALSLQRHATHADIRPRHAYSRAGRVNAARGIGIQQGAAEPHIMIEVGASAIEFIIALLVLFHLSNSSQIKPRAYNMTKVASRLAQR